MVCNTYEAVRSSRAAAAVPFARGDALRHRHSHTLLPKNVAFTRGSIYFLLFPGAPYCCTLLEVPFFPQISLRRLRRAAPGAPARRGGTGRQPGEAASRPARPPALPSPGSTYRPPRRGACGAAPVAPQLRAAKMAPVEGGKWCPGPGR